MSEHRHNSLQVNVRQATEDDIPTLIGFIRDLAIYEEAEDQALATPELLKENIFQKKYAEALICEDASQNGKPIGMAIYFFSFSTWTAKPSLYLEDLYVDQTVRNRGAGKALFRALGKVAEERGCQRMDWQVLDWNKPSVAFYEQVLGAKPMKGWTQERLQYDGIQKLQRLGL